MPFESDDTTIVNITLASGAPVVVAGPNITVNTSSAGSIEITGSAGVIASEYWTSNIANNIFTTGSIDITGSATARLGFSGSLTRLVDGSSYLVAGPGIVINSSSNGSVSISGSSDLEPIYWISDVTGTIFTTGSIELTGSLVASGSIIALTGFTGSLLGTASYASQAVTASYVLQAVSASFATNSLTASYVLQAVSASYASYTVTASQAGVATNALNANTASYVLQAVSSSYASYALTASQAGVATNALNANTASYVLQAVSASYASYAVTASQAGVATNALNANTASYVLQAVSASYASYAVTASQAGVATNALNANTASYLVDTGFSGSLTRLKDGTPYLLAGPNITLVTSSNGSIQISSSQLDIDPIYWTSNIAGNVFTTGSVDITGSLVASGSIRTLTGFTGSLLGTASYAAQASTASYVIQAVSASYASYALTASQAGVATNALNANTASYVLQAVSASYASYAVTASQAGVATNALNANTASYLVDTGFSGSITKLKDGTPYLLAGPNVTITTNSNGSIAISSSQADLDPIYWISNATGNIFTTGSVDITGSLIASGSIRALTGFTGSLLGTASYASQATTASYVLQAVSASYASTASYVVSALTASYVLQAVSASYASYAVTASQAGVATNALNANTASYLVDTGFSGSLTRLKDGTNYLLAGPNITITTNSNGAIAITGSQSDPDPIYWISNVAGNVFTTGSVDLTGSLVASGSIRALTGFTGSLLGTSSYATMAATASYVLQAVSASYAYTASLAGIATSSLNANTASYLIDTGFSGSITRLKDGTPYLLAGPNIAITTSSNGSIQISGSQLDPDPIYWTSNITGNIFTTGSVDITGSLVSSGSIRAITGFTGSLLGTSSYSTQAATASYVLQAVSASFATNALTASYILQAVSSSYASYAVTASQADVATNALNANTASYVLQAVSASYASYAVTASQAGVATNALNANTASYVLQAVSASYASYALTASQAGVATNALNANTASYVLQAVSASYASYALTASQAGVATNALNANTASYLVDTGFSGSITKIKDGTSYLLAGPNITITTNSNGAVAISASLAGVTNYWQSNVASIVFTTGSVDITGSLVVSGSITGSNIVLNGSFSKLSAPNGDLIISSPNNIFITGSLIISGSRSSLGTEAVSTLFDGDIFVSGGIGTNDYIQLKPVNLLRIPSNTTASYIYTSGSDNDMYFTQYRPETSLVNTLRLGWLGGTLSTGLLFGGLLTTANGSTTFSMTSGSGLIVTNNATVASEPYPIANHITWPTYISESLHYVTSSKTTYIGINDSGGIIQQTVPFSAQDAQLYIPVGRILHQSGSVTNGTMIQPNVAYGLVGSHDIFVRAFGPLKISGHILAASGSTLGITKTGGESYTEGKNYSVNPSSPDLVLPVTDGNITVSKIFRVYVSGSTFNIDSGIANAGYTTIDPGQYNSNGVLAGVANNRYSIQRVYWFPNSSNKVYFVYYGGQIYNSLDLAQSAIPSEILIEGENTVNAAILVGYIIVKGNANNLSDTAEARIIQGPLFRSATGGGGRSGGITPAAGLDTYVQFNDGGSAFGGNANLTFNNITNTLTTTNLAVSNIETVGGNVILGNASSDVVYISGSLTASNGLLVTTGSITSIQGFSGSLTKLVDGSNYLLAGPNITITTSSNGSIQISGSQPDPDLIYWTSNVSGNIFTTGSVDITGSLIASGSIRALTGFTGSLLGTASYASQAATASYILQAVSASYAYTASLAGIATSSLNANTASYLVDTGFSGSLTRLKDGTSYLLAGPNVTITTNSNGSIAISGSASVSSPAYWLSNVAGNVFNTGSVDITGSLVASGSIKALTGFSGSHTRLADGTSYLIAGTNITISSASNGAVTIVGATLPSTYWQSNIAGNIFTTGSADITGSLYSSGSITSRTGFTGSLLGTASYATQAATASYVLQAVSASYAYTASLAGVATSSLNANTASYLVDTGFSGSLTRLKDGTLYLLAGPNVTITTNSNGSVAISGSAAATTPSYWISNVAANIFTTGSVDITGSLVASGSIKALTGFSGSHTKLTDGTSYLIAGPNITITTNSNGSVAITGSAGNSSPSYWTSNVTGNIFTTGSVDITGSLVASGSIKALTGFSGSLTKLTDGTPYLLAGANITINSSSNGAIQITGSVGGSSPSYWFSNVSGNTFTTGSADLTGSLYSSGSITARTGLSGSLTTLADGTSYLIAGTNVTISSASNGAITINASSGGPGGTANTGSTSLNFGSAPGTNLVSASVTGQTSITAGSQINAWIMASTTATHNMTEHLLAPIVVKCGPATVGTGFTIYAYSEIRLTGVFTVQWFWN